MKKAIIRTIFIFSAYLTMVACVHIELPYTGIVIDHETKKPITNAVVNTRVHSHGIFGNSVRFETYETTTGNDGKYHLPAKFNWQAAFEFYYDTGLFFNKVGYFTTIISAPEHYEEIMLQRVKYLSDFNKYQMEASNNKSLFFFDVGYETSPAFLKEMDKIATTSVKTIGFPAYFTEMKDAEFTKILCWHNKEALSPSGKHNSTHAVEATNCMVYDQVLKKWFELTPMGEFIPSFINMPESYDLFIRADRLNFPIFANSSSFFNPTSNTYKDMKVQKGNISAIAGGNYSLIAIEDDGKYLCHYSFIGNGSNSCLSASDINDQESSRLLFLTKLNRPGNYTISVTQNNYVIHEIISHYDHGITNIRAAELCKIPISGNNLTGFIVSPDKKSLYLQFTNGAIKKFYIDNIGKINQIVQEDKEFNNKYSNLSISNKFIDFAYGPDGLLYLVAADSKIYRLMQDGSPDFLIEVE